MDKSKFNKAIPAIIAGLAFYSVFIIGAIGMIKDQKAAIEIKYTNSINSGDACLGKNNTLGNLTLEDIGIQTNIDKPYHHTLEIVTAAEDELWEIEHFNGNYYRVRREDYDGDYYGKYEFDTEEPIGDALGLYNYAKRHQIINH